MDRTVTTTPQDAGDADQIIAEELARLLESPLFQRSPVLSRLLQFLADHRLKGHRAPPKAYAIATEALGRSADFDPAIDSYPRVMVGRLRNLLDRYYGETPWLHRLRVPQGSYEIVVQYRAAPPSARSVDAPAPSDADTSAAPGQAVVVAGDAGADVAAVPPLSLIPTALPRRRWHGWRWIALAMMIGAAVIAGWLFGRAQMEGAGGAVGAMPTIEVSRPAAGQSGLSQAIARAADSKLRDGLRRFEMIELIAAPQPGADAATRAVADYRLDTSIVRTTEGPTDVTLVLNRVADNRAIWSQQIRLPHDDIPAFTGLEPAIAQIAGSFGAIVHDQLRREPDNFAAGFPCLSQFGRLRQVRNNALRQRVDTCLRATLTDMPQDALPLATLSLLHFSEWQRLRETPEGPRAFAEAQDFAQRAYDASPSSSSGIFAMARSRFYAGDCQRGMTLGRRALNLNPYDPDFSGFLGLFGAACGRNDEGEALLRRSIALDEDNTAVSAVTLAFMTSQRGNQDEALALLDRMASPSNMEPQYLMVRSIVLARNGRLDEGRQLWRRLLTFTGQPADAAPEKVLREFMITPAVIARVSIALRQSGVAGVAPSPPQ